MSLPGMAMRPSCCPGATRRSLDGFMCTRLCSRRLLDRNQRETSAAISMGAVEITDSITCAGIPAATTLRMRAAPGTSGGSGRMQPPSTKYNEACLRGWRVLRCTTGQVKAGTALTTVERALRPSAREKTAS